MSSKSFKSKQARPLPARLLSPPVSRVGGSVLRSATVGALPVVNRLLRRMRLEEFFRDALPREDGRTKLSPTKALLVLLRNLLLSREPIYGLGEWAARHAPDLLGLTADEVGLLNDDRVGRALDKLFAADVSSLVLRVASASGNITDDTTLHDTWDLLCQLTGRRDFLYVADSKLATRENMAYLHQRQGRFVTVLPKTRREGAAFRTSVTAGKVAWRSLWEKTDNDGKVIDIYSLSNQPGTTAEGYRLVWYHSRRKAELDAVARAARLERALKELSQLRNKLQSSRTRYRQESKVAEEAKSDGVFPLITNATDISVLELLKTYKRQPTIEKRFSQLKTDFEVAPVYLKAVHRIQALLSVYFFALLVEALMERELREAMHRADIDSLPLYPEGRACRWPTARRILDLFEPVQRHTLKQGKRPAEIFTTDLTRAQRRLLKLLGLPPKHYGQ